MGELGELSFAVAYAGKAEYMQRIRTIERGGGRATTSGCPYNRFTGAWELLIGFC